MDFLYFPTSPRSPLAIVPTLSYNSIHSFVHRCISPFRRYVIPCNSAGIPPFQGVYVAVAWVEWHFSPSREASLPLSPKSLPLATTHEARQRRFWLLCCTDPSGERFAASTLLALIDLSISRNRPPLYASSRSYARPGKQQVCLLRGISPDSSSSFANFVSSTSSAIATTSYHHMTFISRPHASRHRHQMHH